MELFGENFERAPSKVNKESEVSPKPADPQNTAEKVDPTKFTTKRSKADSKKSNLAYQFQIMESIGIPTNEIKEFANPYKWLEHFPKLAIADSKSIGWRIDWRRSFCTTDYNPYYDAFVRWQMNKLHHLHKIKFGERYTIYSPKDGQPCMDHDRQSGEGVGPQEYLAVKLRVLQFAPEAEKIVEDNKEVLGSRTIYMVAATLRPETFYGQTAAFVSPSISYGVFAIDDETAFICTYRAARNMAYQGITKERGVVKELFKIKGDQLIGTKIHAPLSTRSELRILPMETVSENKGTAVVSCVPSDSPDDYITQKDLFKKAQYYKIDPEWANLEPTPTTLSPTLGDLPAKTLVERLKIVSPKDSKLLAEAKEIAYKEAFYQGVMAVGKYKGEKVEVAKPKIREEMIKSKDAFVYNEPENLVMSRSADECVVALVDQWYLDYGEPSWLAQSVDLLKQMNTFQPETRNALQSCLDWLNKWACARSYGLGSKLPWDPKYLVESLSDSTIYMAYYTICHHLHSSLDGSQLGLAKIKPEQMTDEVWDYIFVRGTKPQNTDIPLETLDTMKREFEYWYPLDVRSSGKDLINNHLLFFIYIHAALFPKDLWPKGIRANGHLLLNKEKMSKSTGNFLTLEQCVERFGADATRLTLADAGDELTDANFEEESANAFILRIHTFKEWCTVS